MRDAFAAFVRSVFVCSIFILAACSDNGSSRNTVITGTVLDGPIVGATVVVYDVHGQVILTTTSDDAANYRVDIPVDAQLPVRVEISGGTDLVTGRAADFRMEALVNETGEQTVNVSPLTTLAVQAAACAGDQSDAGVERMWEVIRQRFDMGLDTTVFADPMAVPLAPNNIETAVLANEAIAEIVRRAGASLSDSTTSLEDVLQILACDIADSAGDTQVESEADNKERVLAVARAAEATVRLEVLAGRLEVDGVDATQAMNDSIRAVMPDVENPDVTEVPADPAEIQKAVETLSLLVGVVEDEEIVDLATQLSEATPETVRNVADAALDSSNHVTLQGLPARLDVADESEVQELIERAEQQQEQSTQAPIISMQAASEVVTAGGSTTLSWATSYADQCDASWSADVGLQGTYEVRALTSSTTLELTCVGIGGVSTASVAIQVSVPESNNPGDGTVEETPSTDAPVEETPVQESPVEEAPVNPPAAPEVPAETPVVEETPAETPVAETPVEEAPAEETPEPVLQPTVSLNVSDVEVDSGANITVWWNSEHADTCTASGDWSGTKAVSNQEELGPITQQTNLTLTCSNSAGQAIAMTSVQAMGSLELSWIAPTTNADGTPLTTIDGYRLYYGTVSGELDNVIEVAGDTTTYTLRLPVGTYFLAMSTIADGVEGDLSAEAQLTLE